MADLMTFSLTIQGNCVAWSRIRVVVMFLFLSPPVALLNIAPKMLLIGICVHCKGTDARYGGKKLVDEHLCLLSGD